MDHRLHAAGLVLLWAAAPALLGTVVQVFRLPRHVRPDVPRHVRYRSFNHDFLFDDIYTAEGDRIRNRVFMYPSLGLLLIACGLTTLQASRPAMLVASTVGGALGVAAVIALLIADVRRARRAGATQTVYVTDASGRAHAPPTTRAAPDEFGPRFRLRCPCCHYPTIPPDAPRAICPLCDWEASEPGPATVAADPSPSLEESRRRFRKTLSVIDLDTPQPWVRPPTARVLELKRALIDEFDRMEHDGALNDPSRWRRPLVLEHELAREQEPDAD